MEEKIEMKEAKDLIPETSEQKNFRWKTVAVETFKRGAMFFIGSSEDLIKVLDEKFDGYAEVISDLIKEEKLDKSYPALGYTFKCLPDALIWCPKEPEFNTAIHEIFHAACHILYQCEIPENQETEEVYAYLLEYLTGEFLPWVLKDESLIQKSL